MTHILLALLILVNLHMLGTSRIGMLIRDVAAQAVLLSAIVLIVQHDRLVWHEWALAVVTVGVKGLVLPALMKRALRETVIRRDVEPLVGYSLSLFLGVGLVGLCLWAGFSLPVVPGQGPATVVAAALFTISVGLFLVVSRSKAITQTIAYLSMENGIYALSLSLAASSPAIVEMGILLDVFVGVFVMGILTLHINREFDHIDTARMTALKD